MKPTLSFSRRLLLAFVALSVAFAVATFAASWFSHEIEARTGSLMTNALPSIQHLSAACDALRDLEAASDDYPDVAPEEQSRARATMDRSWREIDAHLTAYLGLPAFPGERELYQARVPAALRDVAAAASQLVAQVAAREQVAARLTADRDVRRSANAAARLLRGMVSFNATHARAEVQRISKIQREASRNAVLLAALAVLGGLAVAFWVRRQFLAYEELARAHAAVNQERADELEVFAKRVAHDLLSPLSALTYSLGAFKRASEGDPRLEDALARARSCVHRAQRLVEGIFEFARAGGKPEPGARADVRDAVEEISEDLRRAGPLATEVEVEPFERHVVAASPGVLSSILGNLMSNAAKYMSDSATRRVVVRVSSADGESVRLEVEDTGPGVPEGLEERIFDPYFRAEGVTQAGLGLGLATVKRLCEAHGGQVGVRSTPGAGSIFWFALPKAPAAEEAPPASASVAVRRR